VFADHPLVPAEFWVDVRFRNTQDAEAVVGRIERFWTPTSPARGAGRVRQFLRRLWQALAVAAFLAPFALTPMVGDVGVGIGCIMFASYVATLMVAEAVNCRRDRPPQGCSDGPAAPTDTRSRE
jgi:hypothetical protein